MPRTTTPPPPECPAKCREAVQSGVCDQSCTPYSSICGECIPRTTPPPPQCPARCKAAILIGVCDESCSAYTAICGPCTPTTAPPTPPPPGYLPPPAENSRSSSPLLSNSIAIPPPPQLQRRVTNNVRTGVAKITKSRISRPTTTRGGRKDSGPARRPRNNWDLYLREGIVRVKG